MAEIWIHRKCARESDELILPKVYKDTSCEYCNKTIDKVFLHEGVGENWTAPVEAVEAVEGVSEEDTESIPVQIETESVEEKMDEGVEEAIIKTEEVMTDDEKEDVIETVEEILEELPSEAESEPSVTIKVELDTEEMDEKLEAKKAEIASLKAKLEALEK